MNVSFFASTDLQIGNNRLDLTRQTQRAYLYSNTTGQNRVTDFTGQAEAQMMTCKVYNASYTADFEVNSTGAQFISATPRFQNWMSVISTMEGTPDDPLVSGQMNMQAVMEAFVMMVSGPFTYSKDVDSPPSIICTC